MEDEAYSTFRTFNSIDEAEPLLQLLKAQAIDCKAVNPKNNLNSSFGGLRNAYEVQVLLKPEDFTCAEAILLEEARKNRANYNSDHYLLGFTDEELMDILKKPDEWSEEDYYTAQEILRNRGYSISEEEIKRMSETRMEELRKPESIKEIWVRLGYASALLGGVLGIAIGWSFINARKRLPNGEEVFTYDDGSRNTGRNIFLMGVVCFVIALAATVYRVINR